MFSIEKRFINFFRDDKLQAYWSFTRDFRDEKNNKHAVAYNSDSANDPNPYIDGYKGCAIRASSSSNGPYLKTPQLLPSDSSDVSLLAWVIWFGEIIDDGNNSGATQYILSTNTNDEGSFLGMRLTEWNSDTTARTNNWRFTARERNTADTTKSTSSVNFNYISTNKLYLFVVTRNSSVIRLYQNGELVGEKTSVGGLIGAAPNGMMGALERNDSPWRYHFNGIIKEAAVFNRVLSPEEISEYYRWAIGRNKIWYFLVADLFNPAIPRRRLLIR